MVYRLHGESLAGCGVCGPKVMAGFDFNGKPGEATGPCEPQGIGYRAGSLPITFPLEACQRLQHPHPQPTTTPHRPVY